MHRMAFSQIYLLQQKHKWLITEGLSQTGAKALHCDVVFGVVSAGCRGNGVCKIVAMGEASRLYSGEHCRHAPALLESPDQGKSLHLFLFRELLCPTLLRRQLSGSFFQVHEDFILPMFTYRGLELRFTRIKAGLYPIERRGLCLKICLTEQQTHKT